MTDDYDDTYGEGPQEPRREIEAEPQTEAEPQFTPWPKIARLNRDIVVSEKIDGTNMAIHIVTGDPSDHQDGWVAGGIGSDGVFYKVGAQSRNRTIDAKADHFGFANWVHSNSEELVDALGVGCHFGEWWGRKIGRAYGKDDRTFSLFNTSRWTVENTSSVPGLSVVPTMYLGPFSEGAITACLDGLRNLGSYAAPGFMRPEGVVVFHTASNVMFKVTLENDESPKGRNV